MIKLKKERYLADNLPAYEEKRWQAVLLYKRIIQGPWKNLFSEMGKLKEVWGYYEGKKVYFSYDGYGLAHYSPIEGNDRADIFVKCLDKKELPLYINSPYEIVQTAIKARMVGDKRYAPVVRRDDLIELHYKWENRARHVRKVIELYDNIMGEHLFSLYHRMIDSIAFTRKVLTLTLNNRTYVYQNSTFLVKPEQENLQVTLDVLKNDAKILEAKTLVPDTIFTNFKPNG
jgi:hypothetical protein